MFPVSIGDYNIYLSTIPQPSDYKIVMDELDRTQAAYKMKIRCTYILPPLINLFLSLFLSIFLSHSLTLSLSLSLRHTHFLSLFSISLIFSLPLSPFISLSLWFLMFDIFILYLCIFDHFISSSIFQSWGE